MIVPKVQVSTFSCLIDKHCVTVIVNTQFGVLDFQVEVEVYARVGFLLLCITTFVPRTIEILRMHTLTLPLENLKLKLI